MRSPLALLRSPVAWLVSAAIVISTGFVALRLLTPHASAQLPVALLLSDGPEAAARAAAQAWEQAIDEEGFRVLVVRACDVEREGLPPGLQGVILPDTAAVRLGDRTIDALHRHVRAGGRLFVAFDAGTRRADNGTYSELRSRLSDLVGVDYAQYRRDRDAMFRRDTVLVTPAGHKALALQPGHTKPSPAGEQLTTYGYEQLVYPVIATARDVRGELLAATPRGDAVALRTRYGEGEVLFVNAPLGYLKTRSDGYLLHQGLRLFLRDMLGQPQLLPVPDGVGGVVMNVHVDSNDAVSALKKLEAAGVFREGPWSLHFTAGPDTYRVGDHAGLDLDHTPWVREFIERMRSSGHEIGSHGGWIHNLFGLEANDGNEDTYRPYLDLNEASLTGITGEPPRVYSAPVGNQPLWVNRWLQAHGFLAYYDTGGGALGPTRAWRDGQRADASMWSFPVANFRSIATFEEIEEYEDETARYEADMAAYREFAGQLIDYTAHERVARLTYFHAPAGARHLDVVNAWISRAQQARSQGGFRWYRMDELARFMSERERVQWSWRAGQLQATHPDTLAGMTWLLPGVRAQQLQVVQGEARIEAVEGGALVRARAGRAVLVKSSKEGALAQ
jgi:hypothetical protein